MPDYLDEPTAIQRARIIGTLIGEFLPPLWPLNRAQEETLTNMLNDLTSTILNMQMAVDMWRRERPDA